MHNLSFDPRDPCFDFAGFKFSIQISTFENIYGIDPQKCTAVEKDGQLSVHAEGLTWAAGSEKAMGSVIVQAQQDAARTTFAIQASAERRIRCDYR